MHVSQNVACLIWEHIIGKHDTLAQGKDSREMHKKEHSWVNNDGSLPSVPWALSKEEKEIVKWSIDGFGTPAQTM